MRRVVVILALPILLASRSYSPPPILRAEYVRAAPTMAERIGRIAAAYGVPPEILLGVAMAESSMRPDAVSADGLDRGMFQLRSIYDAERAEKWGAFDAFDPLSSARIAALILREDYSRLGSWDLAIASYRQGVRGVRRRGPDRWYVDRVRGMACRSTQ